MYPPKTDVTERLQALSQPKPVAHPGVNVLTGQQHGHQYFTTLAPRYPEHGTAFQATGINVREPAHVNAIERCERVGTGNEGVGVMPHGAVGMHYKGFF